MDIVLTNDDGYRAPGLRAAYHALSATGTVHVVAPKEERSACGHAITLRRAITVERMTLEPFGTMFSVEGSPADCVRLATAALIERPVKLVVAGVNCGANAGVDTFYSGTIAAAREAALLGLPAIAISQAIRKEVDTDWEKTREVVALLLPELLEDSMPGPGFWSVNLPAPIPDDPEKHVRRVPVAAHPVPLTFNRTEQDDGKIMQFGYGASYWLREVTGPNDYSVVRDGGIAITAIPLFGNF